MIQEKGGGKIKINQSKCEKRSEQPKQSMYFIGPVDFSVSRANTRIRCRMDVSEINLIRNDIPDFRSATGACARAHTPSLARVQHEN